MTYELTKRYTPGMYTLGEGFLLKAKGNELTERQAAPYIEAGILQRPQKAAKRKEAK